MFFRIMFLFGEKTEESGKKEKKRIQIFYQAMEKPNYPG